MAPARRMTLNTLRKERFFFYFFYFFGKEVKNVAASVVTSEQRSVQHPADVVDPPPCSRAQMLQGAEHQ